MLAVDPHLYQLRLLKHLEVLRDRRPGDLEALDDLAYATFTAGQDLDDLAARRIGESIKSPLKSSMRLS